ncbi:MAG TPA: NUDIX domain-containing protein [Beijerinckiaceae bacterium]
MTTPRSDEPAPPAALGRLLHLYWRFARGLTMGVRAVVLDEASRVFLVRHTYVKGWHLPGGGVEIGETAGEALRRELREEAGLELSAEPMLHGLFFNPRLAGRDHVAVYIVRRFRVAEVKAPDREIAGAGFFPLDALPDGTTGATHRRLAEIASGSPPAAEW